MVLKLQEIGLDSDCAVCPVILKKNDWCCVKSRGRPLQNSVAAIGIDVTDRVTLAFRLSYPDQLAGRCASKRSSPSNLAQPLAVTVQRTAATHKRARTYAELVRMAYVLKPSRSNLESNYAAKSLFTDQWLVP
jgi:hypothetical protein